MRNFDLDRRWPPKLVGKDGEMAVFRALPSAVTVVHSESSIEID